jgi:hypothetical protein
LYFIGGSGSWEFVSNFKPIKTRGSWHPYGGSEQGNAEELKIQIHFCREAIEESNFAGHFWELHSSIFNAVSFDRFLRYSRTQPDQFVIHLTLL